MRDAIDELVGGFESGALSKRELIAGPPGSGRVYFKDPDGVILQLS
jgi:hypothetical protein